MYIVEKYDQPQSGHPELMWISKEDPFIEFSKNINEAMTFPRERAIELSWISYGYAIPLHYRKVTLAGNYIAEVTDCYAVAD